MAVHPLVSQVERAGDRGPLVGVRCGVHLHGLGPVGVRRKASPDDVDPAGEGGGGGELA